MAQALLRVVPFLIRILTASTRMINIASKLRAFRVLTKKDLIKLRNIYKKSRDFYNYIQKLFFQDTLKTHQFIFFTEDELREYIKKIDYNAKIIKVVELDEVDLYLVEFNDIKLLFKQDKEDIITFFSNLMHLSLIYTYFQDFNTSLKTTIEEKTKELEDYLIYLINSNENDNDEYDFLEKLRANFKNDVDSIINKRKAEDIANTYCVSCSCSCCCDCNVNCECEDSSYTESCSCCCSCSCNCDIVHYIQSWENARNDLKQKVDYYIDEIKKRIYNDFLDRNNENSYINFIERTLISRDNPKSLIMLYFLFLEKLLFNIREKQKAKLLFAVIKEIKEENKKKIMRALYKFLRENFYLQKIEKEKLLKILKEFFKREFNKKVDDKYLEMLLKTFSKRYLKIKLYKLNNKEYYFIGWNPKKSHPKPKK